CLNRPQEEVRLMGANTRLQRDQHSRGEAERRKRGRLSEELAHADEGRQCRISFKGGGSPSNLLLSPCLCSGSLQFVHSDCLNTWIQTKLQSGLWTPKGEKLNLAYYCTSVRYFSVTSSVLLWKQFHSLTGGDLQQTPL
uniref:RING-type E3 ubiquitin transferase n=1 Tax=Stegastes partitus TaxID=144197 RepID=A0A3B5AY46_9TELE